MSTSVYFEDHGLCLKTLLASVILRDQLARKDIAPVAPVYKYGAVSLSNVLATTCQYEVCLLHVRQPNQSSVLL